MEQEIARALDIPLHTVLVVPILAPWRFAPEDILYHDEGKILSLKETQAEYFDTMRAELEEYLAVRVCVLGDRRVAYRHAAKIEHAIERYLVGPRVPASTLEFSM